jgi:hypothetical protein
MNARKFPDSRSISRAVRMALRSRTAAIVAGALALPAAGAAHSAAYPAEFELSSLLPVNGGDGSEGFVLVGAATNDRTSYSLAFAGDVNGDGIEDVLVGAPLAEPGGILNAGEAFIVFGRRTPFEPIFELSGLFEAHGGDGSRGVVLFGSDQGHRVGTAVAGAGDLNADGFMDVLVGAPLVDRIGQTYAGHTHAVYGRASFPAEIDLAELQTGDGSGGFTLLGVRGESGSAVAGAGDVDGDGIEDLLVGAPTFQRDQGLWNQGQTYLVFGRASGFDPLMEIETLFPRSGGDGSEGTVFEGRVAGSFSGWAIDSTGDINGDGLDDFVIGAPGVDLNDGEAYVVFGRAERYRALFPLAALTPVGGGRGVAGFVLRNKETTKTLGYSVSGAGDVNGDGIDDFLVAANQSPAAVYIVFGRTSGFPPVFPLQRLHPGEGGDGTAGVLLTATEAEGPSVRVAAAGDVNADGVDDVLVGFHLADPGGKFAAGRCYVFYGRTAPFPPAFPSTRCSPPTEATAHSASC